MKQPQASRQLRDRLSSILRATVPPRGYAAESGWGLSTTRGPQREGNEDRCLLMHVGYAQRPDAGYLLALLCDGMGGMKGGDIAAIEAISVFAAQVAFTPYLAGEVRLTRAALDADEAVQAKLDGKGGTTLSAILVSRNGAAVGLNVGDSRIYEVTSDGGFTQRSRDDTIGGLLSTGEESADSDNRLLQHVGMGRALSPHIIELPLRSASYILTSDGAHGIGEQTLKAIVRNAPTPSDIVRRLTYFTDIRGGDDNATAVAITPKEFVEPELPTEGVLCTIWTPFKTTEAWFAIDYPDRPLQHVPDAVAPVAQAEIASPSPRKPTKAKKTQKRKKASQVPLPLVDAPQPEPQRPSGIIEEITDAAEHGPNPAGKDAR